uniref:ER lumen protein-retaining receptor n=1 Tax=Alexandrium andersonii TaxID=327968 RepID=A0A7S2IB59_9DINO
MGDLVGWNLFRLAGDALHLTGMVMGLFAVWSSGSVEGFSRKTQVLYQTVYVTRYLDLFAASQNTYLILFKVTYNLITATMLVLFQLLWQTYDIAADSCNLLAIFAPTAVAAYMASSGSGFREEMWTFSELLEPLALVPQYIMCYRAVSVRPAAIIYTLAVGGYRLLYVCNWIYKRYKWHGAYHDYTSWFGGAVECVLFIDFVVRISQRKEVIGELGASSLGRLLLQLDSGAGRLSEKIEMGTIGRRLPFGLTGQGSEDDERSKRQWDVSDKITDEESCNLLTLSGDADGHQ